MGRSILAEINRQAKKAAREHARLARETERARAAAAREAERARKAEERAEQRARAAATREAEKARKAEVREAKKAAKARVAERKKLEKEAKAAHVAAREAEVEEKNLELNQQYEELDSLLEATLDVDDYVDLDSLRQTVEHPPFDRQDLEEPLPPPPPIEDEPKPEFVPPVEPSGLGKLFGRRKYDKELELARKTHEEEIAAWETRLEANKNARAKATAKHAEQEAKRKEALARERERYEAECRQRESDVEEQNRAIDELKNNLSYGAADAVQEYVSIVLSNSVYPDHLGIENRFSFEPGTAELSLRVLIPGPTEIPTIKAFKYVKSSDEIKESQLSKKACKDRYTSIVHQVALRSLHEIFEADRRGLIRTISLEVGTETIDPATGNETYIPFAAVGAERDAFLELDLSRVVPSATLDHLGAALSKNPHDLVPADVSGIRKS